MSLLEVNVKARRFYRLLGRTYVIYLRMLKKRNDDVYSGLYCHNFSGWKLLRFYVNVVYAYIIWNNVSTAGFLLSVFQHLPIKCIL